MKLLKLSLVAAVASIGLGGAAMAATPTFAVNAAVTSDYVFRGISQTHEYDPAVQGGLDATDGILYAGTWVSNVGFGNGTDAEVDLYGGVRPVVAGVSLDLGAIYYLYPGQPGHSDPAYADENYIEFKGAASKAVGPVTLGVAAYYSPDFTFTPGFSANALYYEGNAAFTPVKNLSVSGAVGHQHIEAGTSYTTWNIGTTWAFAPHLSLDTRYWDTDKSTTFGPIAGPRVAFTLKATYP